MRTDSYTSEGIVLARRNFGEADRILWVYSKSRGRVALIAKGIRRPKSRKRGHLEIFARVNFQAVRSKNLDLMLEAEVIDAYPEIRRGLKKVSLAYYICEVVGKITHEQEANPELYNLILENLEKLKLSKKLKELRLDFVRDILVLTGYWPNDKKLSDPDAKLEEVIERQLYSSRVGKIISS